MGSDVTIPDRDEFKIGEVCEIAGVKPFVLRYWETEFPELQPAKGSGGQRSYTRADVELILRIKHLLYEERFTVAGAKKRLADEAQPAPPVPAPAVAAPPAAKKAAKAAKLDTVPANQVESLRRAVQSVRRELEEIVSSLK